MQVLLNAIDCPDLIMGRSVMFQLGQFLYEGHERCEGREKVGLIRVVFSCFWLNSSAANVWLKEYKQMDQHSSRVYAVCFPKRRFVGMFAVFKVLFCVILVVNVIVYSTGTINPSHPSSFGPFGYFEISAHVFS